MDSLQPFSFFVHNCLPQPDPIPPIIMQQNEVQTTIINTLPIKNDLMTTLPVKHDLITLPAVKHDLLELPKHESAILTTVTDLTEPFIMFDASLAHTLSLSQPHLITHPHLQTQHTSHDHYLH